jgi:hypothetical protein
MNERVTYRPHHVCGNDGGINQDLLVKDMLRGFLFH